jgi:hypothetical protein
MTLIFWPCWPRHAERAKAVDDGEAPDKNEPEMGTRGSGVIDGEEYEG